LFHNGFFPTIHLDHINGVKDDNRIDNLRLATCSQNQANTQKKIGFSSRFKGVNWHKKAKKWVAQINVNGKKKYLGCFHEEDTAAQRYNEAAVKQFGEFALINKTNNNGTTN
jgi:hypothetical protein